MSDADDATAEAYPAGSGAFEAFYAEVERPLAVALAARYGAQAGREAAVDAQAWAWEHWDRVATMPNPAGYLYRVGQTRARRTTRTVPWARPDPLPAPPEPGDDGLGDALRSLTARQRQVVVLAHGYGFTHREIGDLLGITRSSVQNHAERGLSKLRQHLEVHPHE